MFQKLLVLALALLAQSGASPATFAGDAEKEDQYKDNLEIPSTPENVQRAERIYELMDTVIQTEFEVEDNHKSIHELNKLLAGTAFQNSGEVFDFLAFARRLNSLRSKGLRNEQSDAVSLEERIRKSASIAANSSRDGNSVSAAYERETQGLRRGDREIIVVIQSDNEAQQLDECRQMLGLAFVKVCNFLQEHNFHRAVDETLLLGTWVMRVDADKATYEHTLKQGGNLDSKLIPDDPNSWPGGGWITRGTGKWFIRNGRLTLRMDYARFGPGWKKFTNPFVTDALIRYIDEEQTIILDDHSVLEKRK